MEIATDGYRRIRRRHWRLLDKIISYLTNLQSLSSLGYMISRMSAMDALTVASLGKYTSATLHHLTVGIDFSNIHVLSHLHGFPALRKLALAVCTLTYWDQLNPDLSLKEPLHLPSVTAFALGCGRTYRDPYA
jgi:hypothetical protein